MGKLSREWLNLKPTNNDITGNSGQACIWGPCLLLRAYTDLWEQRNRDAHGLPAPHPSRKSRLPRQSRQETLFSPPSRQISRPGSVSRHCGGAMHRKLARRLARQPKQCVTQQRIAKPCILDSAGKAGAEQAPPSIPDQSINQSYMHRGCFKPITERTISNI